MRRPQRSLATRERSPRKRLRFRVAALLPIERREIVEARRRFWMGRMQRTLDDSERLLGGAIAS